MGAPDGKDPTKIRAAAEKILRAERSDKALVNRFAELFITGTELTEQFKALLSQSWTVAGLLPETSRLILLYGPPGSFKSFLAIDIAASVSSGIPWHGRKVKQGPVLYLAAEGQAGVLKRIAAWQRYHEIERLEQFTLLPLPCLIDNSNDLSALFDAIQTMTQYPNVIFLDTLARSMAGDENSTADMGKVVSACGRITDKFGAQVFLIHHTGKDETRGARGAIALTGATDTIFRTEGAGDRRVTLVCERQKDDEPGPDLVFDLEVADTGYVNADSQPVASLVPVLDLTAVAKRRPASREKVSGAQKIALLALREAANSDGTGRVHIDEWRAVAYRRGISQSTEADAKRMAFKRAVSGLVSRELVGVEGDFYYDASEQ